MTEFRKKCVHCKERPRRRLRLCYRCHRDPELRRQMADEVHGAGRGQEYAGREKCASCQIRVAVRPRGLCQRCHRDPVTRNAFPKVESKHARRGSAQTNDRLPDPPEPTHHRPGSPEKIAVMAERLAAGYHPHHPGDCLVLPDPAKRSN